MCARRWLGRVLAAWVLAVVVAPTSAGATSGGWERLDDGGQGLVTDGSRYAASLQPPSTLLVREDAAPRRGRPVDLSELCSSVGTPTLGSGLAAVVCTQAGNGEPAVAIVDLATGAVRLAAIPRETLVSNPFSVTAVGQRWVRLQEGDDKGYSRAYYDVTTGARGGTLSRREAADLDAAALASPLCRPLRRPLNRERAVLDGAARYGDVSVAGSWMAFDEPGRGGEDALTQVRASAWRCGAARPIRLTPACPFLRFQERCPAPQIGAGLVSVSRGKTVRVVDLRRPRRVTVLATPKSGGRQSPFTTTTHTASTLWADLPARSSRARGGLFFRRIG